MRNWINLFETSELRQWQQDILGKLASIDDLHSDEYLFANEDGLPDVSEMCWDDQDNLFIYREICFIDATEWLRSLKAGMVLGEYWTYDMHRAHSYSAHSHHNDCVTICAKLKPAHQHSEMVDPYLHVREAEIRLNSETPIELVSLSHKNTEARTDLYGKEFIS